MTGAVELPVPETESASRADRPEPIEVLVVDDDPSKRYLAVRHLRQAGIVCAEAESGQQGLERARELPLLVLLDVALPDISGFDVCALLKRTPRTSSVLVVLLSAVLTETHHRVRGLSAGADGFITTPYAPEEFVANIRAFLRLARAERARTEALESERRARQELERERDRLQESEQRQRAVLEALTEGVVVYDPQGKVVLANASAQRLLGRTAEEMNDASQQTPPETLHEDGTPWPLAELPVPEALRTRTPQTKRVLGVRRPGGRVQWLSINAVPILAADGTPAGAVSSFFDVTEQRRADEERQTLASIVETSDDFIGLASLDGQAQYINPAGQRLIGLEGPDDVRTRQVSEFLVPEEREGLRSEIWPVVWRDGQWTGEATFCHLRTGRRIPAIRNVFLVRDQRTGRPLALGTVARDITEMKAREAEMERRAAFEQQLVGIVSHDLRNPITAITLGAAQLLRRGDLDERTRKTLGRVVGSAERASRLIRDLLDFTQARVGGGIPVLCAPLELPPLVQQVIDEVQVSFPGRQVQVTHEGATGGEWDGDRLGQLVQNLVRNALTYSPPESLVRVRTRGDGDQVQIEVHNEGEPIPPEKLSRIFEPLQRATSAGQDGRSIGLGLFIVDHVVRAHGGQVQVVSAQGEGTRFLVTLPRRTLARVDGEAAAAS